jgi:hypothetical protein
MRPLDWEILNSGEGLVLVTARHVGTGASLMAADFRDTHAVVYLPTDSYVGMDRDGKLRLGYGPVRMENGIWRMDQDARTTSHKNVQMSEDKINLKLIR